jgi:hypothetical protein
MADVDVKTPTQVSDDIGAEGSSALNKGNPTMLDLVHAGNVPAMVGHAANEWSKGAKPIGTRDVNSPQATQVSPDIGVGRSSGPSESLRRKLASAQRRLGVEGIDMAFIGFPPELIVECAVAPVGVKFRSCSSREARAWNAFCLREFYNMEKFSIKSPVIDEDKTLNEGFYQDAKVAPDCHAYVRSVVPNISDEYLQLMAAVITAGKGNV